MLPEKTPQLNLTDPNHTNSIISRFAKTPFKEDHDRGNKESIWNTRESFVSFPRLLLDNNPSLLSIVNDLFASSQLPTEQMPNNLLLRISQLRALTRFNNSGENKILAEHYPSKRRGFKTFYRDVDQISISIIAPIPNPRDLDEVVEPNRTYDENGYTIPRLWEMSLEIKADGTMSLATDYQDYTAGMAMCRPGFFTGMRTSRKAREEEIAGFEQLLRDITEQTKELPTPDQQ